MNKIMELCQNRVGRLSHRENSKHFTQLSLGFNLVVGPVLKIKTSFRGFETEQNPGFRSLQRYDNKFYTSVHEQYSQ